MQIRKTNLEELGEIIAHPDVKRNVMTFSSGAQYIGAFVDNRCVGCVGWIEYSRSVKFKAGFVLPAYRKQGIYRILCEERMRIVGRKKPIVANCTRHALPYHLSMGAIIIKTYEAPSYKIKYEPLP